MINFIKKNVNALSTNHEDEEDKEGGESEANSLTVESITQ